ncbi:TdiD protein [Flagelloscypha sp. PMI_526]|nr:TdiD protein [Flagelloscypha sp. PMI_526]
MPLPADYYDSFLSDLAKARKPSPIRSLLPLEAKPGMISLLAGKPNPTTFPITGLSISARSPRNGGEEEKIDIPKEDIAEALQYGATSGIPRLVQWFTELQRRFHNREAGANEGWRLSVGNGSQDLISKAVSTLVNPGDPVLVESPVYAGIIPMFSNINCEQIEVNTDAHGIQASSLRTILQGWPKDKKRPKVLYTVPYGCNPTGMTATLDRRKEVLALAREFDLLLLEDDPYFFLYYGKAERYPSYFSLEKSLGPEDQVGRVVRFDSLSKVLSAGIRIGFCSAPTPILNLMDRETSTANLQPNSIAQVITYTLLNSWGYDLFKAHVDHVAQFYREKRDVFEKALNDILCSSDRKLVSWVSPEAGMFFWFKLNLPESVPEDSEQIIRNQAYSQGVLCLPGTIFLPNGRKTAYVRVSFSLNPEEEVREALQRLKIVLDGVWKNALDQENEQF